MKIGIFGTGVVGDAIGSKLVSLGHAVKMGGRAAGSDKTAAWLAKHQGATGQASAGTFADAAAFGELLFNCTLGSASIEALEAAGRDNLSGKILVDVSNPLDFSKGMPPTLFVANTDSLGERIQRAFPSTKVVKALNTMTCKLMVDPSALPGDHDVFMCGDDAGAKAQVRQVLSEWFGWKHVVDLGGISAARGTEAYLLLWLRLWGAVGHASFNVHVQGR